MQSIIDALTASVDVGALAVLAVFVPAFALFTARAKRGHRFSLRPIPAYDRIAQLVNQAIEAGQSIHIGMGSGQIGGKSTAESLAGLTVFEFVAGRAAATNQPVLGTAGNATILASAQGMLHAARQQASVPGRNTRDAVQFAGPDPLAYAVGASTAVGKAPYLASVLIGRFQAEGLWLSESIDDRQVVQLGGTADLTGAVLLSVSLDDVVIGEEVFAAGAYLHRPSHAGSLAAQDLMRVILILSILAGALINALGYWA